MNREHIWEELSDHDYIKVKVLFPWRRTYKLFRCSICGAPNVAFNKTDLLICDGVNYGTREQ